MPLNLVDRSRRIALGRDVEAEIEDRGAVGDPARGDQIDAGGGNRGDGFEADPARGFGHGAAIDHRYRAAQVSGLILSSSTASTPTSSASAS